MKPTKRPGFIKRAGRKILIGTAAATLGLGIVKVPAQTIEAQYELAAESVGLQKKSGAILRKAQMEAQEIRNGEKISSRGMKRIMEKIPQKTKNEIANLLPQNKKAQIIQAYKYGGLETAVVTANRILEPEERNLINKKLQKTWNQDSTKDGIITGLTVAAALLIADALKNRRLGR
ncbi:MAG: hypothetical protein NTZ73_02570 [Candidatus Diapherotrites archaeon]|nr:hypothetical protein [Candidatus Diapherotrites archaeon]